MQEEIVPCFAYCDLDVSFPDLCQLSYLYVIAFSMPVNVF